MHGYVMSKNQIVPAKEKAESTYLASPFSVIKMWFVFTANVIVGDSRSA